MKSCMDPSMDEADVQKTGSDIRASRSLPRRGVLTSSACRFCALLAVPRFSIPVS